MNRGISAMLASRCRLRCTTRQQKHSRSFSSYLRHLTTGNAHGSVRRGRTGYISSTRPGRARYQKITDSAPGTHPISVLPKEPVQPRREGENCDPGERPHHGAIDANELQIATHLQLQLVGCLARVPPLHGFADDVRNLSPIPTHRVGRGIHHPRVDLASEHIIGTQARTNVTEGCSDAPSQLTLTLAQRLFEVGLDARPHVTDKLTQPRTLEQLVLERLHPPHRRGIALQVV